VCAAAKIALACPVAARPNSAGMHRSGTFVTLHSFR
jgi:hypothetical protein